VARQNRDSAYAQYSMFGQSSLNPQIGFDRFGIPIYASQSALMYGCSPFMYGPYDMGWNLYSSQYGCGGYGYGAYGYPGYGYGYGYGGYPIGGYYGGGPVVVPVGPNNPGAGTPAHGKVVNGKGYTSGGGSSSTGTATPRSNNTSPSGSGGTGTGAGASSPPPARTAEPRKP